MLRSTANEKIPIETLRVARVALPRNNRYVRLREQFGATFSDQSFASLFPARGQPAAAPWRLAVVTILQFAECLSDREAADAVRARIDWKYLLGLKLTDSGFDYSILSRFRDRLVEGHAEMLLLQTMLEKCRDHGLIHKRGDMRTDATHVVAWVRNMNRLELAGETLRAALNVLATVNPEWLAANVEAEWYLKYARRFESDRKMRSKEEIIGAAERFGRDGVKLLEKLWLSSSPQYLRELPAVEALRKCWVAEFWTDDGTVRWRRAGNLPPSSAKIASPYDLEARYGVKCTTEWIGYKAHFTETCEAGMPHLITNVDTASAYMPDAAHVAMGQNELARRGFLPGRQFVDGAYIGSQMALESRKTHNIELIGPVKQNHHYVQVQSGYDLTAFKIDWERRTATCPKGKTSIGWWSHVSHTGRLTFHTKFSRTDCAACSVGELCTKNAARNPRKLALLPREEHEWLLAQRTKQRTSQWKQLYNTRAGIEGTISQGVRSVGLRRSRYRGLPKTHLQNVAIACAINLQRLTDYWADVAPAQTRRSALARLGQWVM
jgi:transposase